MGAAYESMIPNASKIASGLSSPITIFPIIRDAGAAEKKPHEFGIPASARTSFAESKRNADWLRLQARVLAVISCMPAFVKTLALRAVKHHNAKPSI